MILKAIKTESTYRFLISVIYDIDSKPESHKVTSSTLPLHGHVAVICVDRRLLLVVVLAWDESGVVAFFLLGGVFCPALLTGLTPRAI
jgi:hypothetical protein